MKKYEMIVIYNPEITDENVEKEIKNIQQIIDSKKGILEEVDKWGRRPLATRFKKKDNGYYILVRFSANNEILDKLNAAIRVNEIIIKYMITNFVAEAAPVKKEEVVVASNQ